MRQTTTRAVDYRIPFSSGSILVVLLMLGLLAFQGLVFLPVGQAHRGLQHVLEQEVVTSN